MKTPYVILNGSIGVNSTDLLNGIITNNQYRMLVSRGNIVLLEKGSHGNSAVTDFESLPQKIKDRIIEKFGSYEQ